MEDGSTFKGRLNGEEKELEVLYTFHSLGRKKDYIIYTDNTYEENNLNIYASIYYPEEMDRHLEDITDASDWNEVEEFLGRVQ